MVSFNNRSTDEILSRHSREPDMQWSRAYPIEEHDVRVMCSDPIALGWHALSTWLDSCKLKPTLSVEDAIDCLWTWKYLNHSTYHIDRGNWSLMSDIPADVRQAVHRAFEFTVSLKEETSE